MTKTKINNSMELQILLNCNWSCHACEAFSNLHSVSWVRKATMTIAQLEHFIKEMVDTDSYIGRIRILGGEPTIHPKFQEMVELLHKELVPEYTDRLEVITNGSHNAKLDPVRHLVKVKPSGLRSKEKHHVANLVHTPAELGYEGKMCNSPWYCGFSLNYYGYFPCSAGAGIARMRDWMKWQKLDLPVNGIMAEWPDLQELCNHCYKALKPEHKHKCGVDRFAENTPSTEAWKQLGPWIHGKQPDWSVYGETTPQSVD